MQASRTGLVNIVKLLVERGAEVNYQNPDGTTAMMLAASNGQAAVVKLLIEKGANTSLIDKWGKNAYAHATTHEIRYIIRIGTK